VSAVDAVAIEAVLEAQAECSDLDRARAALSEALTAARAPARGGSRHRGARPTSPPSSESRDSSLAHWTLTVTVSAASSSTTTKAAAAKSVEAVIVDDAGTIVAQRTLTDRTARTCVPLARAVGAWASLVLDAEMVRAKDDDASQPTLATTPTPTPSSARPAGTPTLTFGLAGQPRPRDSAAAAPAVADAPPIKRSVEIGSMVYIRNGMSATGGFAGASPFITIEVAEGWVVRPSLAFGRATEGVQGTSHVGGRGDLCRRIPGNYIERRGIEADLCAGLEAGVVTSQTGGGARGDSVGRAGIGPAANLRGELAYGLALEVRGLVGANLAQSPLAGHSAPPLVFAAAELGISVRLSP
jgi:hypothetical protein